MTDKKRRTRTRSVLEPSDRERLLASVADMIGIAGLVAAGMIAAPRRTHDDAIDIADRILKKAGL